MKQIIFMLTIQFFIFITMVYFAKKTSTAANFSIFSFLSLISYIFIKPNLIFALVLFLILSSFLFLCLKKIPNNFSGKILTLNYFTNSAKKINKDGKIIGQIIPYCNNQLKHNGKYVTLSDTAATGCMMITGSTGSGKTYGIESLIRQDMKNKHSIVYFDFKGEKSTINNLKEAAESNGIKVFEMSNYNCNFNFDPLASLDTSGRIEALLNTRKWSIDGADAHYRTSTQLLIQKLVGEFEEIWDKKTNYLVEFYKFTKEYSYDRSMYDAYSTVTKMLELLLTSSIKDVWTGKNGEKFTFDCNKQYLAIFSFVSGNKELGNSVASFVFKNILDTGTKNSYFPNLALYIDETGSLENTFILKDLLEKGRSCGIETTIAMQDVNQLVINTNQAYLNSILGTINTFLIYAGATKITAEILSGVQIGEIDKVLMSLKKPYKGSKPTAMYISKYPEITKNSADVFKIEPYIAPEMINKSEKTIKTTAAMETQIEKKEYVRKPKEIDYASIMAKVEQDTDKFNIDNMI